MSAPFTTTLRAAPGTLVVGAAAEPRLQFRVQLLDTWETVRVEAPADTPVGVVKERTLSALRPADEEPDEYLVKLGGWEVLDENATIAAVGGRDGCTFLVCGRRRRPVR